MVLAVIVSISALGALNGTLYTSSRLIVAASEQGFLPRLFAQFNERQKTPIWGILLSSALSTVFICVGDFSNLTLFYGVSASFCASTKEMLTAYSRVSRSAPGCGISWWSSACSSCESSNQT